ncbi:unnamed protein product [marine sediment metagenome]|uniref:Uncharacterized protein n=1 Tax=marine sediment metagenome TaxID=412755 RepID=X1L818_9ZZZZ
MSQKIKIKIVHENGMLSEVILSIEDFINIVKEEKIENIKELMKIKKKKSSRFLKSVTEKNINDGHFATGKELANSELVGIWKGREDIKDSVQYAKKLRKKILSRN